MDSRRSSFQSDSVSLISPAVQHYTPKHPNLADGRNSISQYSSDYSTSSSRANGHLVPPALILRGNGRKDDGRVVSLVQPDPGLDDDSDSDAETVIEAPISHSSSTKIIQVQSCLEKHHQQINNHKALMGNTLFNIENERISPNSQQHRTFRMPVMPQEVEKLQRCECGRYLLTDRDKLTGVRLPGISGGSSGSTSKSNSPTPLTSLLPFSSAGGNLPPARNNKPMRGNLGLNLEDSQAMDTTNNVAVQDSTTPLADQPPPPPPKIINETPTVKIAPTIPPTPQNTGGNTTQVERVVDPCLSPPGTSDFLAVAPQRKKTENEYNESDDDEDGDVTPGNESGRTFQECEVLVEEGKDRILTELLELTDINDEDMFKNAGNEPEQQLQSIEPMETDTEREAGDEVSNDENHNTEQPRKVSMEGSRRRIHYQSQAQSINRPRPTSLPLPISVTDNDTVDPISNDDALTDNDINEQEEITQTGPTTTVFVAPEETTEEGQGKPDLEHGGNSKENENDQGLEEDMTLDELLDSIEKTQDGEVLAVVVQ